MAEEQNPRWWQWLDAGTVTGVLALIFSVYSIIVAKRQYSDSESTTLINETYATYKRLHDRRMDTVEVSHLVCSPGEYARMTALVREATSALAPDERARMKLREHAMAMDVFAQFEQTLYLHAKAVELGETEREKFSGETLDYFTGTLLRNPRLVWFWSASGANMRTHYEPFAQRYWDEKVGPARPKMDPAGPFG